MNLPNALGKKIAFRRRCKPFGILAQGFYLSMDA